ncbi:efflux RND transporter periplasmic adaptor subunit [Rhodanobacter sp. DHG33]|uniref:efflux RND transporter periplasmic adaptor subunit n=1 Tax=Rhodanobacter sp. DHG33 TaxID=2775921 RepID=UPI0017870F21|nr:efflux RND transporter periplasmic adaptor subunit [Rhodanobacter sp. DHG33]MBD8899425.1 efflux RND transporter periplasmic adaptor subunit [Rhodanobacter sp. DHG33]
MSQLDPHPQPQAAPRGLRTAGIAAAVVAAIVVVYGLVSRVHGTEQMRDWTQQQALPVVTLVQPETAAGQPSLQLPGRLQAFVSAPIYARVSGYLKSWNTDIGAHVKKGDLLGTIETPDVDQQLAQAQASLGVAQANAKLAQISAKRWQAMAGTDAVAQQDIDQRTSAQNAAEAQVKAAQAQVDQLEVEKGFARLVAPFDGTVTARDTDVGALINVGSGAGPELFVVSDTSKLRLYVNVPQNYVPQVPKGTHAVLRVPEHPGQTYTATVLDSAGAVSASSGTTLMQLLVDNAKGELMPGGFASVDLALGAAHTNLSVPSSALVFNGNGMQVATLGADDSVTFKQVTVLRDDGKRAVIGSGLEAGDKVIDSPPDGIGTGDHVRVAEQSKAGDSHAKG